MVNLGQAMQAYSVPCWWVVWWLWRAGPISQDTYLLYDIASQILFSLNIRTAAPPLLSPSGICIIHVVSVSVGGGLALVMGIAYYELTK